MRTLSWALHRGARVLKTGVRFSVWAPLADEVKVRLLSGRAAGDHPLAASGDGAYAATVAGAAAGDDYLYLLDGRERPDPVSRWQPAGVHGPSRVVDPAVYEWTEPLWEGRRLPELALYEIHVGTFTPEGTFDAVIPHLYDIRRLGVTAVELMPVAEFPGGRNWGYDGVFPYAPSSAYGGPEALRRLVDAAHAAGLAVILDVVYNHVGPEGNYLADFGPYFTDRYRTPWGPAVNFDGADSDEVRRFVLDNARYWIVEYHLDGLRLDAVHAIFDFSARHILEEIADAVHQEGPPLGRHTLVIAESDLNDPRLLRAPADGGYGLNAQWSDDFHHALHVALTGERDGYYADFAEAAEAAPGESPRYAAVANLATVMRDRFLYSGRYSAVRRRMHGAPASDISASRFIVALQNHDQVGNRAFGERLAALVSPERLRLGVATLLLSPYVPLLFMGEEYGETRPFLYFTSHADEPLVEAVRRGRREEFSAFGWQDELPDPQAAESFESSKLDRTVEDEPLHYGLRLLYADLLTRRPGEPALHPGEAEVTVRCDAQAGWITVLLRPEAGGHALLALLNFAPESRRVLLRSGPEDSERWVCVLTTADPRYMGVEHGPTPDDESARPDDPEYGGREPVTIPGNTAILFRSTEFR